MIAYRSNTRNTVAVSLLALSVVSACSANDDSSAGATGSGANGPGNTSGVGASGGGPTACVEAVDGVVVGGGVATTPAIIRVDSGYAITSIRDNQAWLDIVDTGGATISHQQLSNAPMAARLPSVHPAAGGFVAMWAEGSAVLMRQVAADGTPQGTPTVVQQTTSNEPRPAGASLGTLVGAAWMQGASSSAAILQGMSMQDEEAVPGWFPAVANVEGSLAVAWSQGAQGGPVQVARFDAMSAPATVPGSASLIKTLVAGNAGDVYVAWEEVGGSVEQIGIAKLSAGGEVLASAVGSEPNSSANWSAIAFNGQELAVAYYQFRDGPPTVFLRFFDADLHPFGFEMEIAPEARYPAAVWGDNGLALVYAAEQGPIMLSVVDCM
jgi:hypothetical protein